MLIKNPFFNLRERDRARVECEEMQSWMTKVHDEVHEKHSTAEAKFVAKAEEQQRAATRAV